MECRRKRELRDQGLSLPKDVEPGFPNSPVQDIANVAEIAHVATY
jgi:hypothetical protein